MMDANSNEQFKLVPVSQRQTYHFFDAPSKLMSENHTIDHLETDVLCQTSIQESMNENLV